MSKIRYYFRDYHDAYDADNGRISIAYHIVNCLATISEAVSSGVPYFTTTYDHVDHAYEEPVKSLAANCIPGIMESTEYNHGTDIETRCKYVIPKSLLDGLNLSEMSGVTLGSGTFTENETEYNFTTNSITVKVVTGETATQTYEDNQGVKVLDLCYELDVTVVEPDIVLDYIDIKRFELPEFEAGGGSVTFNNLTPGINYSVTAYYTRNGNFYSSGDVTNACTYVMNADPVTMASRGISGDTEYKSGPTVMLTAQYTHNGVTRSDTASTRPIQEPNLWTGHTSADTLTYDEGEYVDTDSDYEIFSIPSGETVSSGSGYTVINVISAHYETFETVYETAHTRDYIYYYSGFTSGEYYYPDRSTTIWGAETTMSDVKTARHKVSDSPRNVVCASAATWGSSVTIDNINKTCTIEYDENRGNERSYEYVFIPEGMNPAYAAHYNNRQTEFTLTQEEGAGLIVTSVTVVINEVSVPLIPAYGGSVTSGDVDYTVYVSFNYPEYDFSWEYTAGTQAPSIPVGLVITSNTVTAGSLGTTVRGQTTAGTLTIGATYNSVFGDDSVDVLQEANDIEGHGSIETTTEQDEHNVSYSGSPEYFINVNPQTHTFDEDGYTNYAVEVSGSSILTGYVDTFYTYSGRTEYWSGYTSLESGWSYDTYVEFSASTEGVVDVTTTQTGTFTKKCTSKLLNQNYPNWINPGDVNALTDKSSITVAANPTDTSRNAEIYYYLQEHPSTIGTFTASQQGSVYVYFTTADGSDDLGDTINVQWYDEDYAVGVSANTSWRFIDDSYELNESITGDTGTRRQIELSFPVNSGSTNTGTTSQISYSLSAVSTNDSSVYDVVDIIQDPVYIYLSNIPSTDVESGAGSVSITVHAPDDMTWELSGNGTSFDNSTGQGTTNVVMSWGANASGDPQRVLTVSAISDWTSSIWDGDEFTQKAGAPIPAQPYPIYIRVVVDEFGTYNGSEITDYPDTTQVASDYFEARYNDNDHIKFRPIFEGWYTDITTSADMYIIGNSSNYAWISGATELNEVMTAAHSIYFKWSSSPMVDDAGLTGATVYIYNNTYNRYDAISEIGPSTGEVESNGFLLSQYGVVALDSVNNRITIDISLRIGDAVAGRLLTGITMTASAPDIPAYGGTVDTGDVSYSVSALYSDNSSENVTNSPYTSVNFDGLITEVTADTLSATTAPRQSKGSITGITATYLGQETTTAVTIYQAANVGTTGSTDNIEGVPIPDAEHESTSINPNVSQSAYTLNITPQTANVDVTGGTKTVNVTASCQKQVKKTTTKSFYRQTLEYTAYTSGVIASANSYTESDTPYSSGTISTEWVDTGNSQNITPSVVTVDGSVVSSTANVTKGTGSAWNIQCSSNTGNTSTRDGYVTFTPKAGLSSSEESYITLYQASDSVSTSYTDYNVTLTLGTPSKIPAAGGSVNSTTYTAKYATRGVTGYTSGGEKCGNWSSYSNIPSSTQPSWTGVSADSRGTDIDNDDTYAGTLYASISYGNDTAYDDVDVYQVQNQIESSTAASPSVISVPTGIPSTTETLKSSDGYYCNVTPDSFSNLNRTGGTITYTTSAGHTDTYQIETTQQYKITTTPRTAVTFTSTETGYTEGTSIVSYDSSTETDYEDRNVSDTVSVGNYSNWISNVHTGSNVTATYASNDGDERSGSIVFRNGSDTSKTATISVNQNGIEITAMTISVDSPKYISAGGGSVTTGDVTYNVEVTYSNGVTTQTQNGFTLTFSPSNGISAGDLGSGTTNGNTYKGSIYVTATCDTNQSVTATGVTQVYQYQNSYTADTITEDVGYSIVSANTGTDSQYTISCNPATRSVGSGVTSTSTTVNASTTTSVTGQTAQTWTHNSTPHSAYTSGAHRYGTTTQTPQTGGYSNVTYSTSTNGGNVTTSYDGIITGVSNNGSIYTVRFPINANGAQRTGTTTFTNGTASTTFTVTQAEGASYGLNYFLEIEPVGTLSLDSGGTQNFSAYYRIMKNGVVQSRTNVSTASQTTWSVNGDLANIASISKTGGYGRLSFSNTANTPVTGTVSASHEGVSDTSQTITVAAKPAQQTTGTLNIYDMGGNYSYIITNNNSTPGVLDHYEYISDTAVTFDTSSPLQYFSGYNSYDCQVNTTYYLWQHDDDADEWITSSTFTYGYTTINVYF